MKNGENQNPDANNKFVSAYRGKSGIEYGKVYTDTDSEKTLDKIVEQEILECTA